MGPATTEGCVLNLLEDELDQHVYRIMPEEYVISILPTGRMF